MLHAVYRVGNLDETIEYYKKFFGMKQIRYRDIPEVGESSDLRIAWQHKACRSLLQHTVLVLICHKVHLKALVGCCGQEKYTNAFLISGDGSEDKNFALELTYNYGKTSYNIGEAQSACPSSSCHADEVPKKPSLIS